MGYSCSRSYRIRKKILNQVLKVLQKIESFFKQTGSNVLEQHEKIKAIGPNYNSVSINAIVFTQKIEYASIVEKKIQDHLEDFLHPTKGGSLGDGWAFGTIPCHSDFFGLIEKIPEVDYIDDLKISIHSESNTALISDVDFDENSILKISENSLIFNGNHTITVKINGNQ